MPCSKGRQKTGHQSCLGPSDCAICRYANIDPVTDCQTCPMRLRPAQVYRERGTGSCPCLHLHEVPTELRKRDELLGLVPKGKRANHRELHNILSQGLGSTRSISRLLPPLWNRPLLHFRRVFPRYNSVCRRHVCWARSSTTSCGALLGQPPKMVR